MTYPKRLIEVDLPIKRISAHARREKSIRHGHISALHIWWARRPLAACRAVICAALWPDPADENCPQAFRDTAARVINEFAKKADNDMGLLETVSEESKRRWGALAKKPLQPTKKQDLCTLQASLLDFIADFANWDNSTVKQYLETSRTLTQAAHEALGGVAGTHPLVVDPFAGGGAIPLEALRVGADAFASDLNPVAVLLNKVVLEYIPKYGRRLADEVRKWGEWIKREAEKELAEYYPKDPDGATPIAYLWARTIQCEGPGCGAEVPLIRSPWLAKKANRSVALQLIPRPRTKRVDFQIIVKGRGGWVDQEDSKSNIEDPKFDGTMKRGSATCPCCGYTTPVAHVREQLRTRRGGADDARLMCVVTTHSHEQGRFYRLPANPDFAAIRKAEAELKKLIAKDKGTLSLIPQETFTGLEPRRIPLPQYGIEDFATMFSQRQALVLVTLIRLLGEIEADKSLASDSQLRAAVLTLLALAVDKQADLGNSLCAWEPIAQCPRHLFSKQAMNMVWDFAEGVATGASSGSWAIQVERSENILSSVSAVWPSGRVEQASALTHPLPNDTADALITDPPYYFSVPYSDLADFFYVWLRRALSRVHPELFKWELTPKQEECVQNLPHADVAKRQKDRQFYETSMRRALEEARRVAKPEAVGTVVFAHSDTDAWESLLNALVSAGWVVTASWPLDTEMASRIIAQRQVTLASSVHLVCRPRENPDGSVLADQVGDWRDVLAELPRRIHEWMPRLAEEGVVGADAIFACLGPALEVFSRYSRVETASGEVVSLRDYLEKVWAAVSHEALTMIFAGANTEGFEPDSRLTAMWLWTLSTGDTGSAGEANGDAEGGDDEDEATAKTTAKGGFVLEYDAARKIAQGLGARLEQLTSVVEVKGDKARLLPVAERTKHLFGKDEASAPSKPRKKKSAQMMLFEPLAEVEEEQGGWGDRSVPALGETVLDRIHQSMILFAAGRSEALKRFLVEDGVGRDARYWRLAQALSALYPTGTDEKRWVEGILARKKGLGF